MSDDLHDWLMVGHEDYDSDASWEHMSVDSNVENPRVSSPTAPGATSSGSQSHGPGLSSSSGQAISASHGHHHHHHHQGVIGLLGVTKSSAISQQLRPNSALSHLQQRRAVKSVHPRGAMERANLAIPKYPSTRHKHPNANHGVLMSPRGTSGQANVRRH